VGYRQISFFLCIWVRQAKSFRIIQRNNRTQINSLKNKRIQQYWWHLIYLLFNARSPLVWPTPTGRSGPGPPSEVAGLAGLPGLRGAKVPRAFSMVLVGLAWQVAALYMYTPLVGSLGFWLCRRRSPLSLNSVSARNPKALSRHQKISVQRNMYLCIVRATVYKERFG
jgi:hypothetical protein